MACSKKREMMADTHTSNRWGPEGPPTCILTGAEGENEDDCSTHEHETPAPRLDFDRRFDNERARDKEA